MKKLFLLLFITFSLSSCISSYTHTSYKVRYIDDQFPADTFETFVNCNEWELGKSTLFKVVGSDVYYNDSIKIYKLKCSDSRIEFNVHSSNYPIKIIDYQLVKK